MNNLPVVEGRSCDGCTKCCEGYMSGKILGKTVDLNNPCFLVEIGKGCGDYENRPEFPCKSFQCDWLINPSIPDNFKPSESNVIMSTRPVNSEISYMEVIEAGSKLDSEVLTWSIAYSMEKDINIVWNIEGNKYWLGDDDFCDSIEGSLKNNIEMPNIKKPITTSIEASAAKSFYPPKYDPMQSTKIDLNKINEN
jgi:hypothetical protein